MKITAEFNSNEELLNFINTFGAKSITPSQGVGQTPKNKKEAAAKVKEEKKEDPTPEVNAEIVSEETPDGDVVNADSAPVDEANSKEENKTEITKEMVRAIFTKLIKAGKANEAKALTSKYGASKLPELKEENYEAAYKEAEALL